ncbi:2-dehydropantoate 2-reductase [Sporormia fimetaria CBS 119925]|uniref:2-dehydropantoate 2-reductase n=1 Tax=Sporormia fimetaria CBS 119925 TaxID=1340428 RepID=A0A6A6V1I7_9PLEO|nr:2-dehydropantoate 2-reductase [Sporormia fimetaria CBS 119925]
MEKNSVLVIGGGAVGAIAALNLEVGGFATVTLVLRSNYEAVKRDGYTVNSCDHGMLKGWKPTHLRNTIPDLAQETLPPYDYIVLTTKNIPDIPPSSASLIAPAIPDSNTHTTVVLIQNGLNIEKPFIDAYPNTPILSGVSMIGSTETALGVISQEDHDRLLIGAFENPNISTTAGEGKAKEFVKMYSAGGKTECVYSENVKHDRWRKLVYNAALNPICAIVDLDTGRIRLADGGRELVGQAMKEVVEAARKAGVELKESVVGEMIEADPLEVYLKPSMMVDVEKGNFIEFENLIGEPLREGKKLGVAMPTLEVLYLMAKVVQWRVKEKRGMVEIPAKREMGS